MFTSYRINDAIFSLLSAATYAVVSFNFRVVPMISHKRNYSRHHFRLCCAYHFQGCLRIL